MELESWTCILLSLLGSVHSQPLETTRVSQVPIPPSLGRTMSKKKTWWRLQCILSPFHLRVPNIFNARRLMPVRHSSHSPASSRCTSCRPTKSQRRRMCKQKHSTNPYHRITSFSYYTYHIHRLIEPLGKILRYRTTIHNRLAAALHKNVCRRSRAARDRDLTPLAPVVSTACRIMR